IGAAIGVVHTVSSGLVSRFSDSVVAIQAEDRKLPPRCRRLGQNRSKFLAPAPAPEPRGEFLPRRRTFPPHPYPSPADRNAMDPEALAMPLAYETDDDDDLFEEDYEEDDDLDELDDLEEDDDLDDFEEDDEDFDFDDDF